jgi:hypothetical protein
MAYTTDWFLEQARLGNMYSACNQAAATVTLINTSTTTGFVLSNPAGSGKKMVIKDAMFAYTTVPTATAVLFLAQSIAPSSTAHASVTNIGIYNVDGRGATGTPVGKAYSASTTPNLPVYSRILGYSPTTPATTGSLSFKDEVNGALILLPGTYVQISYITTAPVGITYMSWVETDLND